MSCKYSVSLFTRGTEDSDQRLKLRDVVTPKLIRSSIHMSLLRSSIVNFLSFTFLWIISKYANFWSAGLQHS